MNTLYYGDNLAVLRESVPNESVDLIYLDPPFNSKRDYNVLFKTAKGESSDAQIVAFEDSWHWGPEAEREYSEIVRSPNTEVAELVQAFRSFLGENDTMAYLTMMANRLLELHRVLKPTGSLYLHCDPSASHYLKLLLDAIFGTDRFRNEIIWHYGGRGAKAISKQFPRNHDVIFYYTKSASGHIYHKQYTDRKFSLQEAKQVGFRQDEEGRWFKTSPRGDYTDDSIEKLRAQGRVHDTKSGSIRIKYFLENHGGTIIEKVLVGDVWSDIPDAMHIGAEALGYPTQKPLALLERIISTSSNPGDAVLDPFCGCGTAVHAAQKLGRQWIGIDITHLAVSLIEKRMKDAFPAISFLVQGTPTDIEGARDLAIRDKYQFQWWACFLVDAQPYQGKKKGADGGIDGLIFFEDEKGKAKKIIVSVKGGENIGLTMLKDLIATVKGEKAEIGLFVTLTPPTKPMIAEAARAGYYDSPLGKSYPCIQILTIEGLMSGTERPEYPLSASGGVTFKKAKTELRNTKQSGLFESREEP